jgi:diguanylate cyclase (GGDEF)-like protein/PAS domain S-box-containing protein
VATDVIAMRRAVFMDNKKAASEAARRMTSLFAGNPLPMWIYDLETLGFVEVNESAMRQYGYDYEDFLGMSLLDLCVPEEIPATMEVIRSQSGTGDPERIWTQIKKDRTRFQVTIRANNVTYEGRPCRFVVAEDITERKNLHEQLFRMAHHDSLTGLPNRTLLEQRIAQAFATAKERDHRSAIICLDLDRFKQVNDWYGHAIGDECLKQVGTMLVRRLRGMDTVARTGGEEFTVVLGEVESVESAGRVGNALLQVFSKPLEIEGHKIELGASMGIAVYPDHGTDTQDLWRNADAAMYRAKRAGGLRYVLVAPDISTAAADNLALEAYMRTMLRDEEFLLHYQMQYDLFGKVRGMEALLRLPDPSLGYVSPDRFITLAEENGLIHPLGRWVIEESCRKLLQWNTAGRDPVRIAVNVSPLQLMRSDFVAEVREIILRSGVNPAWLEMEITERVVLNFDVIAERMREISALGIRFAVDDFGTGYSSLQHLNRLPISTVKIDRSFVQRLCENQSSSFAIVEAIIAMGHSLNMQVIAEGVEDKNQMKALQRLGCDAIQGYFLARPLPEQEIEAILRGNNKVAVNF